MLHRRAQAYACLPSDLMAIEDDYLRYCFDEVVEIFGTMVDGLLKEKKTTGSGDKKKTVAKYKTVRAAIREALLLGSGLKVGDMTQLLDKN